MRTGIVLSLSRVDQARLIEIVADRNSPQKHVWRAQIVLLSTQGVGTNEIMRATEGETLRVALAAALHGSGQGRAFGR